MAIFLDTSYMAFWERQDYLHEIRCMQARYQANPFELGGRANIHHAMPLDERGVDDLRIYGDGAEWNVFLARTCSLVASHCVWGADCPPSIKAPLRHSCCGISRLAW